MLRSFEKVCRPAVRNKEVVDEDVSFDSVIRINIFLLKLAGILGGWRNILLVISLLSFTTYSVSYTYELVVRADTLDVALEFFTLVISFVGGQARYLILLVSRGKFLRMLRINEDLWRGLDASERKWLRRYANKTQRLTYYYLAGCIVTIFLYILGNLLALGASGDEAFNETVSGNLTAVRNLPYAFLFDVRRSPYFEIIYVYQAFSVVDVGLVCIATDTVGPVLIMIACGHLKVIQQRLLHLGHTGQANNVVRGLNIATESHSMKVDQAVQVTDVNVIKKLNGCVNYHQTILQFCNDIESLTNVIFLTQLFGSTYNISLVGFKLAGNDPDKMKYTSQVSIAIIQLFLCNWPPDLLVNESEGLINAAYCISWYQYSIRLRKSVCIVLMRAQRPIRLTAGKIVILSLETFASMVSSAASFFTVIRNMN